MIKRITALLLVVFTVIITASSSFSVLALSQGDVNGDGKVSASDYLMLKRYVLGSVDLSSSQLSRGDMDGDGDVDKIDYIRLKRTVLGTLNSSLAVPQTEVISYGKSYTTSISASGTYPDTYKMELTDGAFATAASYTNEAFCGYTEAVSVVVDLGSDGVNIRAFEVSYLSVNEAGILPPGGITVYGSANNSTWTQIAYGTAPATATGKVEKLKMQISSAVDYRYIKFTITKRSAWIFIDEVMVYGEVAPESVIKDTDYYAADTLSDSTRAGYISSVASGVAFNPDLGTTLVSKGKSYTMDCAGYDTRCGYSSSLLTNGATTGTSYASEGWVGIKATRASSITVNLGSVQSDLCTFGLYCYNLETASVLLPDYVDISVSSNNYTYYTIGRAYAPATDSDNQAYVISLNTLIKARYVRFTFPAVDGYVWVEEAAVYANRHSGEKIYGNFEMPLTEIPSYWSSTDEDYYTEQNLISGLCPEIRSYVDLAYNQNNFKYNGLETSKILTDGKKTESIDTVTDPWFGFYGGEGRTMFFDLGALSSVSGYSLRLLHRSDWAIYIPSYICVYLSDNGQDWYMVAAENPVDSPNNSILLFEGEFGQPYRARYVMFDFDVDTHVYMDEIVINGTKNIKGAMKLESSGIISRPVDFDYGFDNSSEKIGGAEDVCLFYFNTGTYNYNTVLPYVAYLDDNGNIVDTMFDSFLFLPGVGELPSGGKPWSTNYASDWTYLMNQMFASGRNFDALEKAAGKVKDFLNKPDYTLKLFVTIPHMDTSLTNFGDIDGDGVSENLTNINTRVYVSTYYAQMIMDKFESKAYENIELCGFYWFHEEIQGTDATTAKAVNAGFDDLGMPLFWIPWYCAPGYNTWKTNGFDVCCMQPNYAFNDVDESRLKDCADIAESYGMCIEIEIHEDARTDDRAFKKYMEYLAGGVKYGYMDNAIHMYYQSFNTIGSMWDSESDKYGLIYDYTYQFIKGALDIKPESVDSMTFSAKYETPYYDTVNPEKTDGKIFKVSQSPAHGALAFDQNGNFVYYPNKGFRGTDTFTYQISNYLGWSEPCTITITIE